MASLTDPDLPGDKGFVPTPHNVIFNIETPLGTVQAIAMTVSPTEQANQHHNQLRYAELQRLRKGQPNRYEQTRYRH